MILFLVLGNVNNATNLVVLMEFSNVWTAKQPSVMHVAQKMNATLANASFASHVYWIVTDAKTTFVLTISRQPDAAQVPFAKTVRIISTVTAA